MVVAAIAGVMGCGSPTPPLDEGQDGGVDAAIDAAPDAPPDAPPPPPFAPLHVQTLLQGAPDLTLSATPTVINTTALTIGGVTNAFFVQENGYAILFANAFSVQSPVTITGALPLIVVARDQVTIAARIDLGAVGVTPGPGALGVNPGSGLAGATLLPVDVRISSGGGGASHGTMGGAGGTTNAGLIPAGAAGMRYGLTPADPLVGGSSGGQGGFSNGPFGVGGGGGGALQISSAVSITVLAAGSIKATGGGGTSGAGGFVGGGGGGSGGEILLEAPVLTIAGGIVAGGGGGGGGGSGAGGLQQSTSGQDGTAGFTVAKGGTGLDPQGSNGGDGAAVVAGALVEAKVGSGFNSKGGGGGGGAGRIWLRHRAATPPVLTGATISPLAGTDPTLP